MISEYNTANGSTAGTGGGVIGTMSNKCPPIILPVCGAKVRLGTGPNSGEVEVLSRAAIFNGCAARISKTCNTYLLSRGH